MGDFKEAIYAMEDGKTVIRPNWGKGNDVGYIMHLNKITTVLLNDGSIPKGGEGQIPLSITDYKADNWEIFKKPSLSDKIFTMPDRIKCGSFSKSSNSTGTDNIEHVCEVSDKQVELLRVLNVQKSIELFVDWCEEIGYKDREPSPPFKQKAKEIFGDAILGDKE